VSCAIFASPGGNVNTVGCGGCIIGIPLVVVVGSGGCSGFPGIVWNCFIVFGIIGNDEVGGCLIIGDCIGDCGGG
jgi:hypothetical protein